MTEEKQEAKESTPTEESATPETAGTEPEEETESEEESASSPFLSPEGFIMMGIAGFLDILGLIGLIPGIGTVLSYIPDVLGLAIISSWTLFRSQNIRATPKAAATLKKGAELAKKTKAGKKVAEITKKASELAKKAKHAKKLKWIKILAPIGEFIPIIGIAPLWLIAVYFELKG